MTKLKYPPVKLTALERRALRMAIWNMLDDDDTRSKLYDWQVEALQTAAVKIAPEEA